MNSLQTNDLQTITDAWGAWYSAQNGTTCSWTASLDYSQHSDLSNHMNLEATSVIQSITYDSSTPPVSGADLAYALWYDNGTSVPQQETFTYEKTTSETVSWTITEGLKIGVELSATIGVPEASGSAKLSTEVSLSSTQRSEETVTNNWSVNVPVSVPANSSVKACMMLSTESYATNYTVTVLLQNYVAIWNNDRVNGHYLWFFPIGKIFSDCQANNIIDTTGYTITPDYSVMVQANGKVTGNVSVSVGTTALQFPFSPSEAQKEADDQTAGVCAPELMRLGAY